MYAITGITGRVGGTAAKVLRAAGHQVRAVLRDPSKAKSFEDDIAIADSNDVEALTRAFSEVEGVFVMVPPNFAPEENFPETRAIVAAIREALIAANPPKVVALSSIGAHREGGLGLIEQCHILEEALRDLPSPVAFVRPGWFMENELGNVAAARQTGKFLSNLQPLDRPFPMVATEDVGRICGETLLSSWTGVKIVELEGPRRLSPNDLAAATANVVGHPVEPIAVPREDWTAMFEAQGMPAGKTDYRAEMVDGFNSGWIEFEGHPILGRVSFEEIAKS